MYNSVGMRPRINRYTQTDAHDHNDVAYMYCLITNYSALDKYLPFVCTYFFSFFLFFSFLVKSFSIVYFVVFTVATICGE